MAARFEGKKKVAMDNISNIVDRINVPKIGDFVVRAFKEFIDFVGEEENKQALTRIANDAVASGNKDYEDDDGLKRYSQLAVAFRKKLTARGINSDYAILREGSPTLDVGMKAGEASTVLKLLKTYQTESASRYTQGNQNTRQPNKALSKENGEKVAAMIESIESGIEGSDVIQLIDTKKMVKSKDGNDSHLLLASAIRNAIDEHGISETRITDAIDSMNGYKADWNKAVEGARELLTKNTNDKGKKIHKGQQSNIDYLFNGLYLMYKAMEVADAAKMKAYCKLIRMMKSEGKVKASNTFKKAIEYLKAKNLFHETLTLYAHPFIFSAKRVSTCLRLISESKDLAWILSQEGYPGKVELMDKLREAESDLDSYYEFLHIFHMYLVGKKSPLDNTSLVSGDVLRLVNDRTFENKVMRVDPLADTAF